MILNEKGFAISTILYGLLLLGVLIMSLLMSTASFNLTTTRDFVNLVEEDLNLTADATLPGSGSHSFSGSNDEWEAPNTGYYRVRLCSSGICTEGVIYLVFRQKVYYSISGSRVKFMFGSKKDNNVLMYINSNTDYYISGGAGSNVVGADNFLHSSGKYFINAVVSSGGSGSSISYINTVDAIKNSHNKELEADKQIRFIKDCTTSSKEWAEVQVMSGGKNVASGKNAATDLGTHIGQNVGFLLNDNTRDFVKLNETSCIVVDIGVDMDNHSYYSIDQIAIFAQGGDHTTSVSADGINYKDLGSIGINKTNMGGANTGIYYNAYGI